jgi:uncharacterized protein YjbJ (UPF0337 family)
MDTNRMEGMGREFGGRIEEAAGDLTGDAKTQAEGRAHQIAGRAQAEYGAAVDSVVNAATQVSKAVRAQPLTSLVVAGAVGYLLASLRR